MESDGNCFPIPICAFHDLCSRIESGRWRVLVARHHPLLYSLFMRILIATGLFPPESGGPATYAQLLSEELPKRGFVIDILPFRTVRMLPTIVRHVAYFVACVLRGLRADVIYAQDTVSVGFPAALASFLMGKKMIVRVPGDHAWEQGTQRFGVTDDLDVFQTKTYGWRVEILRSIERFVVRRAHAVIVPSEYMQRIVSMWGVPQERIQRIYSSIALPVPYELPVDRPEGFLIVTAARLVPWKGIDEIVHVVAQKLAWRLVVVGDGPDRTRLEDIAMKKGVRDRVRFAGQLPRPKAMGWVKSADVFALNSTYEGLSYLLVEAMALGTPVVATAVGGNPELINSATGALVPVHDTGALMRALESIEANPSAARGRAEAARERIGTAFSAERAVDELVRVINRI